jgi:hypothetical protein
MQSITYKTLHAQNGTNGYIEFLQPYPTVVADILLETSVATISAWGGGFKITHHRQTLPVSENAVSRQCIVTLSGTSMSGYALLNAQQTEITIQKQSNVQQ